MNLINGKIKDGQFLSENINIKKFSNKNGKYILGFRAEDATISKSSKGNIIGPIFSVELLGDAIMVTLKIDESFISVKVNNDFEASIGDMVNISILSSKCQIFDFENGFNLNTNKEK